jgi:hypothetical protein
MVSYISKNLDFGLYPSYNVFSLKKNSVSEAGLLPSSGKKGGKGWWHLLCGVP